VNSIVFDPFLSVDQSLTTVLVDFGVIRAMMSPAPQTSAINLRPRPAV
jgi:hypothetical protein